MTIGPWLQAIDLDLEVLTSKGSDLDLIDLWRSASFAVCGLKLILCLVFSFINWTSMCHLASECFIYHSLYILNSLYLLQYYHFSTSAFLLRNRKQLNLESLLAVTSPPIYEYVVDDNSQYRHRVPILPPSCHSDGRCACQPGDPVVAWVDPDFATGMTAPGDHRPRRFL